MNMLNQHIKLEKATIKLISENIVECHVTEGSEFDVNDLKQIKRMNLKLTHGRGYAVLIVTNEFMSVSKAASKLMASGGISKNTHAYAFLIFNLAHKLAVNFYLRFHKPITPTRFFTDRNKAIEWLNDQLPPNINLNSEGMGISPAPAV